MMADDVLSDSKRHRRRQIPLGVPAVPHIPPIEVRWPRIVSFPRLVIG